ncbi:MULTISPECIES: hypothetical protein [unclassified Streptomyces]|uniref:hypothetical protein n=1 Tax=unclassified Streptomyces TaxID=2593676 RepID=UPI0004C7E8CD|nr:hypothetical protein [Streptomyces sp. NRRL F-5727]
MSPAPAPHGRPATPAGRPARLRRLLLLVCGLFLVVTALGALTGEVAGPAAEPRPAGAPAAPDPAGETYEPGPGEAALPGRTRHRRTRVRPVPAPPGPRPARRAPRLAGPAPVPAPRPPSRRPVVMRC